VSARFSQEFDVLGFGSTHDALAAEALLKDMGVATVPIPAPRSLGSLCGIALRLQPEETARAEGLLENAGIRPTGRARIEDV
jgi:hypothetical protein